MAWIARPPKPTRPTSLGGIAGVSKGRHAGDGVCRPRLGTRMVTRCARLQQLWSEILRYHKNVAYIHEMERVRDAAAWLLLYSSQL